MKKAGTKEIAAAVLVLLAIGAVYYAETAHGPEASSSGQIHEIAFVPIKVENPRLQTDKIRSAQSVEYSGRHRNIFSETPPPPPPPSADELAKRRAAQPPPPPPLIPALVVNLKFFGYVDDHSNGLRRAFFTDGDENVFIAAEGDTLEGRFRLLKIRNDSVEMEELASGRRTVVMIEPEPGGTGPIGPGANGQ